MIISSNRIAVTVAAVVCVLLHLTTSAQYAATYRIIKKGKALPATLPQPFQASIDSFYSQAMKSGGKNTLTLKYVRSESDSETADSLFIKKLKDDIDRNSYIWAVCSPGMTEISMRTSQAASIANRYVQRKSRFIIDYNLLVAQYRLDSQITCYRVEPPDSFVETGRKKQVGRWACKEYSVRGDTTLKIWASSALDAHINPGLYCPFGGVVQVSDVNGSRLMLTSVIKRRIPNVDLVCDHVDPDIIHLAARLHRMLN